MEQGRRLVPPVRPCKGKGALQTRAKRETRRRKRETGVQKKEERMLTGSGKSQSAAVAAPSSSRLRSPGREIRGEWGGGPPDEFGRALALAVPIRAGFRGGRGGAAGDAGGETSAEYWWWPFGGGGGCARAELEWKRPNGLPEDSEARLGRVSVWELEGRLRRKRGHR